MLSYNDTMGSSKNTTGFSKDMNDRLAFLQRQVGKLNEDTYGPPSGGRGTLAERQYSEDW